ncbi:MAG: four helix bundle protein [Fidelibacterota bacterium]
MKAGDQNKPQDLAKRTFQFSIAVLHLLEKLSSGQSQKVLSYQLSRSATSIGANYEESQASQSKEDFYYKIGICLREARETHYWLRIIQNMDWVKPEEGLEKIVAESLELVNIFGKIFSGRPK